jgi:hypothetical protein
MMDFSEKEEHDDILPDTNVDRERTLTGKWALAIMVAAVIFTTVAFVTPNWVEGDPRYKLMAQNYGFVKYELLLLYFSLLCAFRNFLTKVHLIEASGGQEVKFHEIEIQLFHEIKTYNNIDQEVEFLIMRSKLNKAVLLISIS